MPVVFTNAAESIALKNFLNNLPAETLVLKLYTNNRVPDKLDVAGDYTELSGFGYNSVTLTPGDFLFTPGDPTTATFPQITFTFTGAAGSIFGYFVIQQTSGLLMFANRFSNAPINIANSGDEIRITLTLTLNN